MHVLNSAHVGAAIICGLFVLMLGIGISYYVETIATRRDKRAHIEPTYETSPYRSKHHDH